MPFTVAHAAAVLPLRAWSKSRLPMAALMIGSMSPDFIYFLPDMRMRVATHDLAGLFWFCWPVGLAAWVLFVRVLERPSVALLPDPWRTHIAATGRITPPMIGYASIAIILGAITHDVWDSFTHAVTPMTDVLPVLREVVIEFNGQKMRLFFALQIASSVFGMLVLAIWAWRLPRSKHAAARSRPEPPPGVPRSTRLAALAALAASSCLFAAIYYAINIHASFQARFFNLAVGAMAGWIIAWCAIAVWLNARPRPG